MNHQELDQEFEPRNAAREDRRQANEALGRSFCKTLAEPITNSDSSAKRKLNLPQPSGLVEMMLATPKGTLLDTSAMKAQLLGKYPKRSITVEVVTNKLHKRPPGQIVVTDQAEGMSASTLRAALDDIVLTTFIRYCEGSRPPQDTGGLLEFSRLFDLPAQGGSGRIQYRP